MRPTKTTKEIGYEELDRLKHPEARETAAFDPIELADLVDRTARPRLPTEHPHEDDLAIPVMPMATPPPTAVDAVMAAAWCAPTKESAVIVSTPPEDDPAPVVKGMRALTRPPGMPRGSGRLSTLAQAEQVAWMHRSSKLPLLLGTAVALLGAAYLFVR